MKQFLKHTFWFALITVAVIVGLVFLMNYIVDKKSVFKVEDSIDKIVIGHSLPECAYNDSLISNFGNFASSGETSFYTYYKLKKLLEENQNIKTIFVEFANNQIAERMNEGIWGSIKISHFYPTYSPFIDYEGNKLLATKNFSCFLSITGKCLKQNLYTVLTSDYDYTKKIGGHLSLKKSKADSLIKKITPVPHINPSNYVVSEYNVLYLEKIIALIKKNNINVYLLRTPWHRKCQESNNEVVYQKILKQKFSSIECLDFRNFNLENSDFADLQHLNFKGAKKISTFFNILLEKGLLQKSNKQEFINDEMLKWNSNKELSLEF